MDELEIFIICHDQETILHYERNSKFKYQPHYRYVFVGSGPADKIEGNDEVIICRNLLHNIEQYKYLVSFTAWYALVRNKLIRTKYVSLLEYDVSLSSDFYTKNLDVLMRTGGMIGYVIFPLNSPVFLGATPHLYSSIKKVYGLDVAEVVQEYIKTTGRNSWCSTSNCTMPTEVLEKFVDWYLPLTEEFREEKLGAHVEERAIKIFAINNNIKTFYLPGVLQHQQLKSHKIEALI